MSFKRYSVAEIGSVTIYKNRRSKSIRISVTSDNKVRVSMPVWLPYVAGINYVKNNYQWIENHLSKGDISIRDGQTVGKYQTIRFIKSHFVKSTRVTNAINEITVEYSDTLAIDSETVQNVAKKTIKNALKIQTANLIKKRLDELSIKHNLAYNGFSVKELKSRWGSCNSKHQLVINLYLIQLPWNIIDYVLLHELAHTKVMSHGNDFWKLLLSFEPNAKDYKKQLKKYSPKIY
ncbi:MAG TPA: SprT family zinc-dependent metalloprotease [Candidatus Saccharimonadia bacterium]|nr:SprT family zinc-dependent metalloprotease [Candidatus Saccharimonadia bacterium]